MAERRLTKEQDALLRASLINMAAALKPVTVRGLYYQAVISSTLPFITKDHDGERTNYRAVQSRVQALRQEGLIEWDWVIDPSRTDYSFTRWNNPADFASTAPHYYRLDLWADQPFRPVVLVEKDGQVPVYRRHADHFGVDVWACKGYSSTTHLRTLAQSIEPCLHASQDVRFIICADFDPSGCDWPRAAEQEIRRHLGLSDHDTCIDFHRELVTLHDLHQLGPAVALRTPNPKDTRIKAWLEKYSFTPTTEAVVEMDAINPNEARQRLENIYLDLFEGDFEDRRGQCREHEEQIRSALATLA